MNHYLTISDKTELRMNCFYLKCRLASSNCFLGPPMGVATFEILSIFDNCVGIILLSLMSCTKFYMGQDFFFK